MNKDYEFKGNDWTELGIAFGLLDEDSQDTEENAEKIKEFMSPYVFVFTDSGETQERIDEANEVAEICAKFLKALIKALNPGSGEVPLWEGLLQCHKDTMIKYTCVLLEHMWS